MHHRCYPQNVGFYPFANVDNFTEAPVLPKPPQVSVGDCVIVLLLCPNHPRSVIVWSWCWHRGPFLIIRIFFDVFSSVWKPLKDARDFQELLDTGSFNKVSISYAYCFFSFSSIRFGPRRAIFLHNGRKATYFLVDHFNLYLTRCLWCLGWTRESTSCSAPTS